MRPQVFLYVHDVDVCITSNSAGHTAHRKLAFRKHCEKHVLHKSLRKSPHLQKLFVLIWDKECDRPVPEGHIWVVYSKTVGLAHITVLHCVCLCVCNVIMPLVLTLQSSCPAHGWRGVSWRWRWPGHPWCGSCRWGFGRCSPHTQVVDPWAPTLRWALPAVERQEL